nr:aminotransferase class IV [Fodinibius salsisoli]
MYGEGVFETFRVYQGRTLLLEEHINRLRDGLGVLGISAPGIPSLDELRKNTADLLQQKELLATDAIVRIQCWQEGMRGYQSQGSGTLHYMIMASKCPNFFEPPTLATVDVRRIPSQALPSVGKFTNGINYILAAREAAQKGADDALMQTMNGWVSETTIANLFWIKNDQIFTPSEACDLLPGITRQAIITITEDKQQWALNEGQYRLRTLDDAEAIFMCNSVREVLSVHQVDGKKYDTDHPVTKEVQQLYSSFRAQHLNALQ